jgi:hypothetical protein
MAVPGVPEIRKALNLEEGVWAELPDDLILAPFVTRGGNAPKSLLQRLKRDYDIRDNELIEFLGDAVLELLVSEIVLSTPGIDEGKATRLRQEIVRNSSLDCFMSAKRVGGAGGNLCSMLYVDEPGEKACADAFEAIVGVLHYWLRDIRRFPNALEILRDWLNSTWHLDAVADEYLKSRSGVIVCSAARTNVPVNAKLGNQCTLAPKSRTASRQVSSSPAKVSSPPRSPPKVTGPVKSPPKATSPARSPPRAASPRKSPVRSPPRAASPRKSPVKALPVQTDATRRSIAGLSDYDAVSTPDLVGMALAKHYTGPRDRTALLKYVWKRNLETRSVQSIRERAGALGIDASAFKKTPQLIEAIWTAVTTPIPTTVPATRAPIPTNAETTTMTSPPRSSVTERRIPRPEEETPLESESRSVEGLGYYAAFSTPEVMRVAKELGFRYSNAANRKAAERWIWRNHLWTAGLQVAREVANLLGIPVPGESKKDLIASIEAAVVDGR